MPINRLETFYEGDPTRRSERDSPEPKSICARLANQSSFTSITETRDIVELSQRVYRTNVIKVAMGEQNPRWTNG
jgi:hypothetical protein